MTKKHKLTQRKINIIYGALIGILFAYSIFTTWFALGAYRGLQAVDADINADLFSLRTTGGLAE